MEPGINARTAQNVGTLTGCSLVTVNNWIWLGRLKAVRTQTGKIAAKERPLEFITCYVKENPNRLFRELKKAAKKHVEQFLINRQTATSLGNAYDFHSFI